MAVTDVLSLDEFVDLYKILEISPQASEPDLRERVNKLYLEAQRNIDHHNFRKRFYYQQLYEIHLPQAHQLLLDSSRRAEYDQYLDAFNKGLPFPDAPAPSATGTATAGDLGRVDQLQDDSVLPAMNSSAAPPTPTIPAKSSTPTAKTTFKFEPETATTTPRPSTKPSAPATPAARPAKTTAPVTPAKTPATPAPAATSGAKSEAGPRSPIDVSEAERRRDHKRRELIKGELVAVGQTWGIGVGVAVFLICVAIAFFLSHRNPLIIGGGAVAGVVLGVLAARLAVRQARQRVIVVLSRMPYDELLRRCAQ